MLTCPKTLICAFMHLRFCLGFFQTTYFYLTYMLLLFIYRSRADFATHRSRASEVLHIIKLFAQ